MSSQNKPGFVTLPDGAPENLRQTLGLRLGERPRISYLSVASDMVKSLEAWQRYGADPEVPKATFGHMFFEMIARFDAEGQVFSVGREGQSGAIRVDAVPPLHFGGRLHHRKSVAAQISAMADALDRFDPHVVVVSSSTPLPGWARLTKGRRAVFYGHNALWPLLGKPGLRSRWRWRKASGLFDAALFASEAVARQGQAVFGASVPARVAVPQVSDTPDNRTKGPCRRVLYLGAIAENRGVFQLCEAVATLRQDHPDLTLHLLGDGPDAPRLQAMQGAGLRFDRGLGAENIRAALAQADVLVQASFPERFEGWAEFAAEAAAYGVPLVLSDAVPVPGFAGQAVSRFPAGNAQALQAALGRLVADDTLYSALCAGYGPARAAVWDRAQSWGSQLGALLLTLPPR